MTWAQYTEYHAKMAEDLDAFRERHAQRDAERDAKGKEDQEKAERSERMMLLPRPLRLRSERKRRQSRR